jgi:hypothetical protein
MGFRQQLFEAIAALNKSISPASYDHLLIDKVSKIFFFFFCFLFFFVSSLALLFLLGQFLTFTLARLHLFLALHDLYGYPGAFSGHAGKENVFVLFFFFGVVELIKDRYVHSLCHSRIIEP